MNSKYNWQEIQDYHNQGYTWREITKKFGVSSGSIHAAQVRGQFISKGRSESLKLRLAKYPRVLSQETKDKISVSRKKFLEENPDKVPYLMNHYSKGDSYPEKYFRECLFNNKFISKFRVDSYELDFADVINKIDLEIDGEQHFADFRIKEHDKKRNLILSQLGWKVIRVRWSLFQKKTYEEKKDIIEKLNQDLEIKGDCILIYEPDIDQTQLDFFAERENARMARKNVDPDYFHKPKMSQRKIFRPSLKQLEQDLGEMSFCAVGRKYGVSQTSIRKWIRLYKTNPFFQ